MKWPKTVDNGRSDARGVLFLHSLCWYLRPLILCRHVSRSCWYCRCWYCILVKRMPGNRVANNDFLEPTKAQICCCLYMFSYWSNSQGTQESLTTPRRSHDKFVPLNSSRMSWQTKRWPVQQVESWFTSPTAETSLQSFRNLADMFSGSGPRAIGETSHNEICAYQHYRQVSNIRRTLVDD